MIGLLVAVALSPNLIKPPAARLAPPTEFYTYLRTSRAEKDAVLKSVERTENSPLQTELKFESQTWQGIKWNHNILLQQPERGIANGTAILFITGDGPRPGDLNDLKLITAACGLPVGMLFDIPNQPIWDKKEDDLIAHSFERYLETKDASWPLLFPMAKSAIRAMDVIQAETAKTANPIRRFVVAGASKRGWTTWFVGCSGDKRVVGIAPMVIDNLNINAQMPHQHASWGSYSVQIEDYTRRGLQSKLSDAVGNNLARIVDPYSYRENIKAPTFIINGGNDPYWTADASSMYWNDLRQPKWILTVPNAGHSLGNRVQAIESLAAFARARSVGTNLPVPAGTITSNGSVLTVRTEAPKFARKAGPDAFKLSSVTLWTVTSTNTDFRAMTWRPAKQIETDGATNFELPQPQDRNLAAFLEFRFKSEGRAYSSGTPVQVFKRPN